MDRKPAQSLIEYALILALVTLVAITVLSFLGTKVKDQPQQVEKNPEDVIEFVP